VHRLYFLWDIEAAAPDRSGFGNSLAETDENILFSFPAALPDREERTGQSCKD